MEKKSQHKGCGFKKEVSFVILLISVLLTTPLLAGNHGGLLRQVNEKKVTINKENVPVKEILEEIQRQTGFDFVVNADIIAELGRKSLKVNNITVDQVLKLLLQGSMYEYQVVGTHITFVLKNVAGREEGKKVDLITVKGKVTDAESKQPIPGATVLIVGTTKGATTDSDGVFTILVSDGDELEFSFIGMKTERRKVSKNVKDLIIFLHSDVAEIDEVVVTGMFTRRAESFTGSTTTFNREELMRVGNQNLLKSLKNLDPAFQIMENLEFGSDPNRLPNVQLRGQTSFPNLEGDYKDNPNQPLFILDGFETTIEKVFDLDMNRVASVTLLKDAAAKAIYGSKAGNGVVVIETVRPKSGELRVYYSGDFSIEAPDLTGYDLMDAKEKLAYETKAGMYGPGLPDIITDYEGYKIVYDECSRGVDTYWLSKPLNVGFSHKHSLNLEGGDEHMRYQAGISFNKTSGVMKGSERNTLNLNTTLSYTYKKLIFRNMIEFTRNWAKNSPYGVFSEYTSLNPYWAPYDENDNLVKKFTIYAGADTEVYNPLYNATLNTKDESAYTEVNDNFSLDWKISDVFRATGTFSYRRQESGSNVFYPAGHTMFINYDKNGMSDRKGQYTKGDGESQYISMQAGLNFNKMIDEHLFFANVTWNIAMSQNNSTTTIAEGFGNDYMDDISFATKYQKDGSPFGSNNKSREIGIIGAVNYSYDDRYLFDVSLRKSASSVYGSDNPWGSFWSFGLGWNIHHESFLQGSKWIKQLKLRASMGYTGTQNVDPSQSRARYEYSDYVYSDKLGAQLVALPNNRLKWQRNMDYNLGIDLVLKRFLTFRAEYYLQRTDDLLSDISLPSSTGFLKYKENLGEIENRGYELAFSLTPWRLDTKHAYVTLSVTALHNTNKIKKIYNIFKNSNEEQNSQLDENSSTNNKDPEVIKENLNKYTKPATLYYEGCSMTAIWGVQSLGIDPASGNEMYLTKDGKSTYTWSSADQIVIGDTQPKMRGTINLNAGYKGFTISASCSYKFGGDLYNSDLIARMENVSGQYNLDRRITKAWREAGDIAPYRKITHIGSGMSTTYTKPTSRFVQKNNELYISSVNVGYDFAGSAWLEKISLERLKISFYMNELLRLSSIDIERGTSYPFARNFSLSLQATF